jgi:hypothetical protein
MEDGQLESFLAIYNWRWNFIYQGTPWHEWANTTLRLKNIHGPESLQNIILREKK